VQNSISFTSFKGKISRWVKYNFIPDTRILWKRSAYRKTKDIFSEHKIDLVFSSSPPQTNHIIARKIARKFNIPWVADFRDPWTDVFWLNNNSKRLGLIHRIDKSIERKTIQSMDAIVTVSPSLVSLLSQKTKKKIDLIYNGFDEDMIPPQESIAHNDKFTVTYAGSMSFEQNPVSFFKCIEQLSRNESFAQGCRLRFIGNFPPFLHEMIRNSPLSHCFELTEYTDHQKAIEYIAGSDLLLMIVPQTPDNKCVVTSKVFDYLAVKVPILAYGPVDGDAASIIKQADAGEIFDYNDVDNSCKYLLNQFQNHVDGNSLLCSKDEYIRSFSRRNLTAQLAEIFHSLTKT